MPFQKGNNANPKGRPPDSKEFKKARSLLREALIEVANKGFYEKSSALEKYLKGDIPIGIKVFLEQIKKGNVKFIEILMDRILGKCIQQTQVEVNGDKGVTFTLVKESENRKEDEE